VLTGYCSLSEPGQGSLGANLFGSYLLERSLLASLGIQHSIAPFPSQVSCLSL